jgi:hypothetical protein
MRGISNRQRFPSRTTFSHLSHRRARIGPKMAFKMYNPPNGLTKQPTYKTPIAAMAKALK